MNFSQRISSILKSHCLDSSVSGFQKFCLSSLDINTDLKFELPENLRLGHLIEKVVSELIKASSNYNILYENIQVIEYKTTIGEIDFIIENIQSKEISHLELAYKFYLFDPNISSEIINNWIGPNRNDSLIQKLDKLKNKQFPLLHQESSKTMFKDLNTNSITQVLCLLVSLYIPYNFKETFTSEYEKAIKGFYLNLDTFSKIHQTENTYFIPSKKSWGIHPSDNSEWEEFENIKNEILLKLDEKQSVLCWQKHQNTYTSFFIVWWNS